MNSIGFSARPSIDNAKSRWDFPPGTIIVKEVYSTPKPAADELPIQLTIMVKAPKDPRSQGGWIWLTRDLPDGKESVFMGTTHTCHDNANEKHPYGDGNPNEEFMDYVYSSSLAKRLPERAQTCTEQRRHRGARGSLHRDSRSDPIFCSDKDFIFRLPQEKCTPRSLLDISDFPFMREPSDRLVDDQAALS